MKPNLGVEVEDSAAGEHVAEAYAIAEEWAVEIERRVRAAKSGESPALDGPTTLDEIFG